ncbi:winged helix-turn-helix domain-containing protein [Lentilactobacillus kisonensis]|uniref:Uncharacterized protein n=1 Tax=Lentilactobacillus kisonensis DSM 19906 = JCM 15041 TaxID=1423766 RepID=A0A0R1NTJ4_9LACO|nr:winged helix-turn-helix domain-containing protein [Lentilactobacillus kisonensis]KRL20083.1 hypothetical protein FC98_GL001875 [Lentilactobacillus kisonensis DSM 19906 = JCM 15041]
MDIKLKEVIQQHAKKTLTTTELARRANLSRSTVTDALKRPINKTSFGVVTQLLLASNIPLESVVSHPELTAAQEEVRFLNQCSLKGLTIMGIKFSTPDHFWKTRDSIITSIYEGDQPTKADVNDAYQQLEKHVPTATMIDRLVHEYGGHQ